MRSHRKPAATLPEANLGARLKISESDLVLTGPKRRFFESKMMSYRRKAIKVDKGLCVIILNWGLISDSDNRAESYSRLSEGVSVCDRIRSLQPRSRRRIWAPYRKSPNLTLCRPGRSANSELRPRGQFRSPAKKYPRLTEGVYDRCISTHALRWNFSLGTEFRKTDVLSTVSECRFQIVVT
ncbi:hypothetical protein Taro_038484 [Colocasia esculenta]|uniref:Uncharacterized protein n=1 Tax=Colocasia esculenta TaxID=4460 RepID=A0A843WSU5_COLES|nr:hypothetical protein [Colocasia esculenta]